MPHPSPHVVTITAPSAGPTVALLGGVHGDEYEGVIAARWLIAHLRSVLVKGSIRAAAPAHPAAWETTTRESPLDGKNLARVFPGNAEGTPTESVARELTERVLRGADLLIDLHSAGTNFEMPFLCGFQDDGGSVSATSRQLADVFAADFTWRHSGKPAPGRSLSVAFELGIPAIYTEGGGGRSVRFNELTGYTNGVLRVLRELSMVAGAPSPTKSSIRVLGDGNTDIGITSPASGFMVSRVESGEPCATGQALADIVDIDGKTIDQIRAPQAGYLMMRRREARVEVGDTALIFAVKDDR
jgi:predicted deacylase